MAVTSAAVRTVTAGVHRHWLLEPIGPNDNQCNFVLRSSTAYCDSAQLERNYLISTGPSSQASTAEAEYEMAHPPVYRPLVDLATMENRHIIIAYRLDRATIQELCAQLEPELMSAIRQHTGIPPLVQVLSVLHFLASGSFQTTVAMVLGMSQPMFANVLTRVLSALLNHMPSYIVFPQLEDLVTVKADFHAQGHIPNIIGIIDGTHVTFVPPPGEMNRFTGIEKAFTL
ncbi:hypothetical protein NDU88_005195 [Pleurodeles waltl]|uniref:Nuclease HARBI1 n=1 Tax=Pleurodeles waltl TaxID=8319 RepID=A0AAV7SL11_PLEWA|nr:hypothetical protein NDU88_005195 [Pleurodeles waltl]